MTPSPLFLCLDQGGHASRALIFDARGTVRAAGMAAIATHCPRTDWVEHDAQEVVESLEGAAATALTALGAHASDVVAAGLATQRSSIVCWDRHSGAALSPVLSWQDRRAHAWLAAFAPHAERIGAITGLRLSAHYGASKLRWCLDHLPAVARAERAGRLAFGPLASFLAYRLLAEQPLVADPANAARTLLWNLKRCDWDDELLALFGVPRRALPVCTSSTGDFGRMRVGANSIPLRVLTGDQSAALFAFSAPAPDVAYVNIGTGAFVQRVIETAIAAPPGLLTSVVWQEENTVCVHEGTVNGAGAALAWAATILRRDMADADLDQWLARVDEPPLFLNGVSGLGAPWWVADFASRFVGDGTPEQKLAAVAESIVFLLTVNLERLRSERELNRLVITGGLAAHDGLCQRLCDVTALPAYRPDAHEATARGTAFLLAGAPVDWSLLPGTRFAPAANAALVQRYRRWRGEMQAALEGLGARGSLIIRP